MAEEVLILSSVLVYRDGFVLLLTALGGQHPNVGTPDYWIPEELFVRPSFKVGCCFFKNKKNVEKKKPTIQTRKAIQFQISTVCKTKPHK